MKLVLDMDDTVFNFVPVILDRYNNTYHDNVKYEDMTDYHISKYIKPECKNIFKEFATDDLFLNLKPKENAVEVITELNKQFDLRFKTAGHPNTAKSRDHLLHNTFPWFHSKQLNLCPQESMINADLLIDDCIDNVIGGEYESILFAAPWNKDFNARKWDILRADTWNDVPEFVDIYHHSYLYREGY